jgi:hypothetical protein
MAMLKERAVCRAAGPLFHIYMSLNVTLPHSCRTLPHLGHSQLLVADLMWRRAVLGGELLKIASSTEKGSGGAFFL